MKFFRAGDDAVRCFETGLGGVFITRTSSGGARATCFGSRPTKYFVGGVLNPRCIDFKVYGRSHHPESARVAIDRCEDETAVLPCRASANRHNNRSLGESSHSALMEGSDAARSNGMTAGSGWCSLFSLLHLLSTLAAGRSNNTCSSRCRRPFDRRPSPSSDNNSCRPAGD